jgi:hypothetical protein
MFKPCHRQFISSNYWNWINVCGIFGNSQTMHEYQQLDIQALIDLLANETQEYTRAYARGAQDEIAVKRIIMDALIAEIKRRKKEDVLPQNVPSVTSPPEQSGQE